MKKVYLVGPTESALTRRGNRHPALAAFLVSKGYELEYISSDFYHATKQFFSKQEVAEAQARLPYKLTIFSVLGYWSNVSIRRVLSNSLLTLKVFFYLLPRLNRGTVLIIPSRPVELIFASALLRLLRGTSVLLDIQDIWPDALAIRHPVKRLVFNSYCHAYLYPSLRFIDKFIHVAPSFVQWLHRYAPRATSSFVPLGFDGPRWKAIPPGGGAQAEAGSLRLVCVGLLQYQIDVLPVVKALVGRSDVELFLIGDEGEGERYPEVRGFVDEHAMTNVHFVGRVEPSEVPTHLATMHLGVMPMISSSIPNKMFDYMAASLPILVLGENDSAELVDSLGIGWATPYTAEGVVALLDRLSPGEIAEKKRRVGQVRNDFDRDVLHQRILEVIES